MNEQLGLLPDAPKIGIGERDDVCRCGHTRDHHADGRWACLYGLGTRFGQCDCKKHRSRKRAPVVIAHNFQPPLGAHDWFRCPPELARRKVGGWFLDGPRSLTVYIAMTKGAHLESLNVVNRGSFGISKKMLSMLMAGDSNKRKSFTLRTVAALEQAQASARGGEGYELVTTADGKLYQRPSRVTIVRVSRGRLDDDNLIGACKSIRDGIAEALGFDDKLFSVGGQDPDGIPIFYSQATPGQVGVFACQVELKW